MPVLLVRKAKVESDPILAAAQRMEAGLRAAFLDAVDQIKGTISLDKLAEAVRAGDENGALAVLALDKGFADALRGVGLEAGVRSFRDAVQATYAAGAKAAIAALPSKVSTELSFNMMSKEAQAFLETYDFALIQQITDSSREAIRQTILRAFKEGGNPIEQARSIRDVIGLTARQEQAVANFHDALEQGNLRQAMDRALRDGRYDRTLLGNIKNGTPLDQAQVDKMTARYKERYLKYRSETIARTESIRASSAGRREAWSQSEKQGLFKGRDVTRVWIVSGDSATCSECDALDGETAGLDEEFAPGIVDPPDPHPDCRCVVTLRLT